MEHDAARGQPVALPEPGDGLTDPRELLTTYLDFYRDTILRKLDGMSEADLRQSRLPSGWTPLQLLKHLAHVERRWLQWGFRGEPIAQLWGEDDARGRWAIEPGESSGEIRSFFLDSCDRSRRIVGSAELGEVARSGGRFNPPDPHPALIGILFHLLQEYARHAGHLDVVRELVDGTVGE
ncbi:MAG TPA: DinB family protein [Candidatus Micrarchaeia archaeon]|nr:DinB family protein [Candidatus Micrarchaeia archaeon]